MKDSESPNVLIISYYWPPSSGSGVQRWMYFAKYLKEYGINPIILTVDPAKASYRKTDESFNDFVKDIKVYKTKTLEPLKLYSLLTTGNSKKGIPQGSVGAEKKGIFSKISRYIRGNIFIPDARIGWKKYAVKKAKTILDRHQIDLVITTGPPHSTHLIGRVLKRKYGVFWLADFRDPWLEIYYNQDLLRSINSIKKDSLLEKSVLIESDKVLVTSPSMIDLLNSKSNGISKDKIACLTNGYDSDKFALVTPQKNKDYFTITFIGLLTENMPHGTLSTALKSIITNDDNIKIKLELAGDINEKFVKEAEGILGKENVNYHGYVSHIQAIQFTHNADLLFSFLPVQKDTKIIIPGKLMEYLATGNPILLIGDTESDAAQLLKFHNNTKTITPQEPREIEHFISKTIENWHSSKTPITLSKDVKMLSRRYKAKELKIIIEEMIKK